MPIGVVEVKKSGVDIMSNRKVHGQLADYLLQLKTFHGMDSPFGIVTNYREWRICWLDDEESNETGGFDGVV